MMCHKDKTFCASSGTCINFECDRWIDMGVGVKYELLLSLSDFKDGPMCAGYKENPVWTSLKEIVE